MPKSSSTDALSSVTFLIRMIFGSRWAGTSLPAVNVAEKENEYSIEVAAPGYKRDDFKIRVNNDVLTISAEAKTENKECDKEYTRQEYSYSSFNRSFRLPDNVKTML